VKIGTWNVEYAAGEARNRLRLQRLTQADADVWVLTETHDRLDLGPLGYSPVGTPASRRGGGRWVTMWTRFPVLEVVATIEPDRTTAAILDAPGRPLLVYGTVLPWHTDKGPTGIAKNWSEHHRVIPEQGAEWARLRDAHSSATVIVAGDLNTTVGCSRYYGTKRGRQLLDAALVGAGLVCVTAEPNRPEDRVAYPFIDHVCVGKELAGAARIIDAWEGTVDGARLSDHSGVVIEVGETAPGSA
jgi:endonuclease/exonuclease/phosphatase family metal-dependent hydrolase